MQLIRRREKNSFLTGEKREKRKRISILKHFLFFLSGFSHGLLPIYHPTYENSLIYLHFVIHSYRFHFLICHGHAFRFLIGTVAIDLLLLSDSFLRRFNSISSNAPEKKIHIRSFFLVHFPLPFHSPRLPLYHAIRLFLLFNLPL